ncbi:hypothetical protein [Variovorax paradoxus]
MTLFAELVLSNKHLRRQGVLEATFCKPKKGRHFWQSKRRQSENRMPLLFLMRLQQVQLPVRVADPDEVRYVSVLLATGLIEAEINALGSSARYAASQVATVIRITEDGLAEIAKMGDVPEFVKTSMRFARGLRLM